MPGPPGAHLSPLRPPASILWGTGHTPGTEKDPKKGRMQGMRAGIKDPNRLYYLDTKLTAHPNLSLQKSSTSLVGPSPPRALSTGM